MQIAFLNNYEISYIDFVITPIIIFIIALLSKKLRKYLCKCERLHRYFLPALYLRLVCSILTFVLYKYYYGYGDTFEYYKGGEIIKSAFLNGDLDIGFELLFQKYDSFSPFTLKYVGDYWYFEAVSNRTVISFCAVFSLFTFSSFLSISIIFTFLAFIGSWLIFIGLSELTKIQASSLAYSTLFIPSYLFWGTGIMKEPICIFALGCFFYGIQKIMINKLFNIKFILMVIVGFFLLFFVKVYILICFLMAFCTLFVKEYSKQIKSLQLSPLSKLFTFTFFCYLGFQVFSVITSYYNSFASLDILLEQIDSTQSAQIINSEGGSGYDLGIIETTIGGVFHYMLLSINVSLFRPYLWEMNKVVNIPTALESFFMLFFFIHTMIKIGLIKSFNKIITDSNVLFCITFVLSLSIMIGAISFNFGTLARYRIPLLPFYFTSLLLIRNAGNLSKTT